MLQLRVKSSTWEAPNVLSYELRSIDGAELPPFTAGAHIDLALPNGLVRSYSLINPQSERHRYVIAVQKELQGRGASKWIHQNLRPGEILQVDGPRNHFALDETAEHSFFIAGGIGITPILCMIRRLEELQRPWELFYCARARARTPFVDLLETDPRVHFTFDREPGARMLDISAVVRTAPSGAHLYCCGPESMLKAFEQATKDLQPQRVHVEYFTATEAAATYGGFTVILARSGEEIAVPAGKTILQALNDAGVNVPHSCSEGVCGTCETRVLDGIPDHRDRILTPAEQAANTKMLVCCSGSKTERLVLDL